MTTNISIRQERRRLHIVTQRQANARMIVRVPYPEVLREQAQQPRRVQLTRILAKRT
jgi:hypothetical protein